MKDGRKMPPLADGAECAAQTPAGASPGDAGGKDSRHNRDMNSKAIFENAVLCAQFLRDNLNHPLLKDVQPEDIEDMSERYYPYLGTEFSPDSVKKIRILGIDREKDGGGPPFMVSLIDHKSLVDYDVSMQLLRYMMCIWTEYRREKEAEKAGSTRRKGFRYPVIIPIVYYEGKAKWTAETHLQDRIRDGARHAKWIPDFEYEVVRIHDYSDGELLERGDEMSLVMLINKIQEAADLDNFIRIPPERMSRILEGSPEQVVDTVVSVIESLCFKIGVSAEEREQCVRKVEARDMGYLFENMEKIDIQGERRKTAEAIARAEEAEAKAEEAEAKAEEAEAKAAAKVAEVEEKLRIAEETIRRLQAAAGDN